MTPMIIFIGACNMAGNVRFLRFPGMLGKKKHRLGENPLVFIAKNNNFSGGLLIAMLSNSVAILLNKLV